MSVKSIWLAKNVCGIQKYRNNIDSGVAATTINVHDLVTAFQKVVIP